jgi:hypothetical protein
MLFWSVTVETVHEREYGRAETVPYFVAGLQGLALGALPTCPRSAPPVGDLSCASSSWNLQSTSL